MTWKKVLIGCPSHDGKMHQGTVVAVVDALKSKYAGGFYPVQSSLLTKCFNQLWCEALNQRPQVTHFAMIHSDVWPAYGWLDKMVELMKKHEADVLSAVIPMKSEHGLTSTAIQQPDPFFNKRFTMKEVCALKERTFTDDKLLINTGLMLVDLSKDWVDKIHFHFLDSIRIHNGKKEPVSIPEDWNFSIDARAMGARIFATTEVEVVHIGNKFYDNYTPWGTTERDK